MRIRRLGYALGAEVTDIDVTRPLDDGTIAEIRQAMLDHMVLHFPGQNFEKEPFHAFGKRFGELHTVFAKTAVREDGTLELVTNQKVNGNPWDGYKNGQCWHSDRTYHKQPPSFSILNCKETPAVGGDTMFANTTMAYDALSPAMQNLAEQLLAIHDREKVLQSFDKSPTISPELREQMQRASATRAGTYVPTVQPIVRAHPETGRKALFLADRIYRFVGMTVEETKPLLDFFTEHSTRYEFIFRHRWSLSDLVMWDNRCTMHIALCDYDLTHDARTMLKCSIKGEPSGFDYLDDDDEAFAKAKAGALTPALATA